MNKTKNIKEKFKVFLVSLFAIIILLEISLRIIGSFYLRKATFDKRILNNEQCNNHTILFLGDSFTFGAGAPYNKNMSYQLKSLLDSKSNRKYKVINYGVPELALLKRTLN
jgi:hypothetical protein